MLLLPESKGLRTAVLILVITACAALPWLFVGLGGPDFLLERYGPVTIWFSSWEGSVSVPDPRAEFMTTLHPARERPVVFVIRVSGTYSGQSRLYIPSLNGERLLLPADMNRLFVFDWYGGDVDLRYEPGNPGEGDISIQWVFGYR